ncbi:hypothetical protein NG653_14610, partial [Robiginitalea sp. 2V75]|nr:hypothetical protein [Robiginitalea marina]
GDGTFTYTDEDGTPVTFDAKSATVVDNTDGTYTITDDFGTSVIIDTNNTVTTLVDNGDGTYTYTNESGAVQTINTAASSNPYDNAASGLSATNVQAALDELAADAAADSDQVVGNEYNTSVAVTAGAVAVTDGGGTLSAPLISGDANNNITVGSDGALYLNVASVSIAETVTNLTDNGDGSFTYVNENGVPQTVSKADLTDNGNGTYTFTNNDGSDVTINTNGIAISNTVAGNRIATITDAGGTVTDIDETITTLVDNADGSFTYTSEDGTTTVFTETDDQTAAEVSVADAGGNFTSSDVEGVLAELAAGSTDDQGLSLSGNTLTLEDGGSVDLTPYLDNTDDQQITDFSLTGNTLTLTLENGGTQDVDLSGYVST